MAKTQITPAVKMKNGSLFERSTNIGIWLVFTMDFHLKMRPIFDLAYIFLDLGVLNITNQSDGSIPEFLVNKVLSHVFKSHLEVKSRSHTVFRARPQLVPLDYLTLEWKLKGSFIKFITGSFEKQYS